MYFIKGFMSVINSECLGALTAIYGLVGIVGMVVAFAVWFMHRKEL